MGKNCSVSKVLDVLVAITIILSLLFSIVSFGFFTFMPDAKTYQVLIGIYETTYLPILVLFTCVILVLWMMIGEGLRSKLWGWLPPFIFFNKLGVYGRMILIVLLIAGTLIGLCGQFFDFIPPAY